MATRSSFRRQKKQTRLSFQPLPSSSPTKDTYSTAVQGRLANVRFEGSKLSPRRSARNAAANNPAPLPTPEPSSQPQNFVDSDFSSTSDAPSTPEKSTHDVSQSRMKEIDSQSEDEIVVPSSKRRRLSANANSATPTRQSTRLQDHTPHSLSIRRSQRVYAQVPSSPPAEKALSIGSAESSGDEVANLFTKPTSRRRSAPVAKQDDPFVVSDDDEEEYEQPVETRRARSRQKSDKANDFVVDDDQIEYISSAEDEPVSAKRRAGSKSKQRSRSRKIQDELDDDLQNLQDSDQSDVVEFARTRGGPVTTQRDRNREHLDLLKRRRAGEPIPRIADSDDDDEYGFGEGDGVDLDQITDAPSTSRLQASSRQRSVETDEDEGVFEQPDVALEENEDDDFIVEDESQPFNEARSGIPLAFTSFASRKPRELFIHVIEWLVKNKIAPAFSRDDELYVLSWNKINDQIKAQAGSRLISAAWNQDFKYAILARPHMEVHLVNEGYDEFFLNCDACNRTNHPARYEFKFTGHAYHDDTLEPVDDEDEDEDDEDADEHEDDSAGEKASYDQHGHLLPSAHRTYNLGRFCAANAEMGHKLTHWKYHLNQSLLTYLEEQGVLSADAIVAREKLNKKKREKEAHNIVDLMQETGKINEMWQGLQDDLEDARYGMEDHVAKGGKRSQNRVGKVRASRPVGNGHFDERRESGQTRLVIPSDSEGE